MTMSKKLPDLTKQFCVYCDQNISTSSKHPNVDTRPINQDMINDIENKVKKQVKLEINNIEQTRIHKRGILKLNVCFFELLIGIMYNLFIVLLLWKNHINKCMVFLDQLKKLK